MEAVSFIYWDITTDCWFVLLQSTGLGYSNKLHYGLFCIHYRAMVYACYSRTTMEELPANAIFNMVFG